MPVCLPVQLFFARGLLCFRPGFTIRFPAALAVSLTEANFCDKRFCTCFALGVASSSLPLMRGNFFLSQ